MNFVRVTQALIEEGRARNAQRGTFETVAPGGAGATRILKRRSRARDSSRVDAAT